MSKVTSKLQLTVPKAIADHYGIRPGDELEWVPAGDSIRVAPPHSPAGKQHARPVKERLKLFDQTTERLRKREPNPDRGEEPDEDTWKPHERERGWRRKDLYTRGSSR